MIIKKAVQFAQLFFVSFSMLITTDLSGDCFVFAFLC